MCCGGDVDENEKRWARRIIRRTLMSLRSCVFILHRMSFSRLWSSNVCACVQSLFENRLGQKQMQVHNHNLDKQLKHSKFSGDSLCGAKRFGTWVTGIIRSVYLRHSEQHCHHHIRHTSAVDGRRLKPFVDCCRLNRIANPHPVLDGRQVNVAPKCLIMEEQPEWMIEWGRENMYFGLEQKARPTKWGKISWYKLILKIQVQNERGLTRRNNAAVRLCVRVSSEIFNWKKFGAIFIVTFFNMRDGISQRSKWNKIRSTMLLSLAACEIFIKTVYLSKHTAVMK